MGQPTNLLLGGQAGLLGADPELYRQQLLQQEQARVAAMPAQNQLAGTLGGLLGRGISNVAQDRGFFEVTNPVLQKLTDIQGVYNRAMQSSDPNDPLSFYKNLQAGFADRGLGQQALMAAQELRKAEEQGIKTESAKLDFYAKFPDKLQTDIAKFRDQGNDTKANELAGFLGKITAKQELDRAKDLAQLGLINAQTGAQTANAQRQLAEIESGKFDWKVITDPISNSPLGYAVLDKKTKEITYEKIGGGTFEPPAAVKKQVETPKGEKKDTSWFQQFMPGSKEQPTAAATQPAAAPVAVPAVAAPVSNIPALDPQTRIYYAARDPVLAAIKQAYAADPQRIATDPAYFQQLTKARNDQIEMLRNKYGNMVSFEGL